jgi:serine/threonine protein phosphatase PrpC
MEVDMALTSDGLVKMLDDEIERLTEARKVLNNAWGHSKRRTLSKAARAKISLAMRQRWRRGKSKAA